MTPDGRIAARTCSCSGRVRTASVPLPSATWVFDAGRRADRGRLRGARRPRRPARTRRRWSCCCRSWSPPRCARRRSGPPPSSPRCRWPAFIAVVADRAVAWSGGAAGRAVHASPRCARRRGRVRPAALALVAAACVVGGDCDHRRRMVVRRARRCRSARLPSLVLGLFVRDPARLTARAARPAPRTLERERDQQARSPPRPSGPDRPRDARHRRAPPDRHGRAGRRGRRRVGTRLAGRAARARCARCRATGRQALAEMRRLLGVLRDDADSARGAGAACPAWPSSTTLVDAGPRGRSADLARASAARPRPAARHAARRLPAGPGGAHQHAQARRSRAPRARSGCGALHDGGWTSTSPTTAPVGRRAAPAGRRRPRPGRHARTGAALGGELCRPGRAGRRLARSPVAAAGRRAAWSP